MFHLFCHPRHCKLPYVIFVTVVGTPVNHRQSSPFPVCSYQHLGFNGLLLHYADRHLPSFPLTILTVAVRETGKRSFWGHDSRFCTFHPPLILSNELDCDLTRQCEIL